MNAFINTAILFDPLNWIVVVLILLFVAYGGFVIWSNAAAFTPSLPART